MNVINRFVESLDWISLLLFSCLLSIAVVRQFTSAKLTDFLSVYGSARFIKITQDDRVGHHKILQNTGIIVYGVGISLLIFKLGSVIRGNLEFSDFILIFTAVNAFLLFKHYLSKLISNLAGFDHLIISIDHHRNVYRAAFSLIFMVASILVTYVFPFHRPAIFTTLSISFSIVFFYHLVIFYNYRKQLIPSIFYFILYLCTLEIAPYMLLYKWFIE